MRGRGGQRGGKLYKGSITSDGSPLNEMNACIAAGQHPNLIKVLGRVVGHPDNQAAPANRRWCGA